MDRAALKKRLDRKEALLESAYDLQEKLLSSAKESASMDSGDGRVAFKNRELLDVDLTISRLESDIARLEQRLAGTGVMNIALRRHC